MVFYCKDSFHPFHGSKKRFIVAGQDSFQFKEVTLRDIVKDIRERYEIKLELHDEALKKADATLERKQISLSVGKCSLRSALRLVLDKLNLTYYLDRGTVYITTPDDYHERMKLRSRWLNDTLLMFHAPGQRPARFPGVPCRRGTLRILFLPPAGSDVF